MSLTADNPAIGLETRRFLNGLIDSESGLDQECVSLVERSLEKARPVSPCGWVRLLASSLGASRRAAMVAASFSELFYAMCSTTDDVQDGEAAAYLGGVSIAAQINVAMQLLCLTVVRAGDLATASGRDAALDQVVRSFLAGAVMLRGQRHDLTRELWSIARYREVAALSAGRQFEVYLRAAALAARTDPSRLVPLAIPLGTVVQIRCDREARDSRLEGLPAGALGRLWSSARSDLGRAAARVPGEAAPVVAEMIRSAVGEVRRGAPAPHGGQGR